MTAQPATQVLDAIKATPAAVAEHAARILAAGGLVAFPTETVYGLVAFGGPVVAPSANRSGHVSPTTAQHVLADLRGHIELIVDGGATPMGLESTIIACLDRPVLLRPGALPRAEIERLVRLREAPRTNVPPADVDELPMAPGALASHYAPRARLRLNAQRVERGAAVLAFGAP